MNYFPDKYFSRVLTSIAYTWKITINLTIYIFKEQHNNVKNWLIRFRFILFEV